MNDPEKLYLEASQPATLHHAACRGTDGDERAAQTGIDHGIPIIIFQPHQQVVTSEAGVVDENVNGAELFLDFFDQLGDGRNVGNIAREPLCRAG